MEPLTLKPRKAVEEAIENWDDDDFDIGGDDLSFRSTSNTTSNLAAHSGHHGRESISSRLSIRSDFDSNHGDEPKQVLLPGDDERSTIDAIAAATKAGIPLPQNVPPSALMGGTIKRLGGRKIKKIIQDDWDDELELPTEGALKIKQQDASNFPEALRQVSALSSSSFSPTKSLQPSPSFEEPSRPTLRAKPGSRNLNLERFKDNDDDDFFGDMGQTIKVPKQRSTPKPISLITPPTPQKNNEVNDDDFEKDFQLPDEPLRLTARRDIPKTPSTTHEELDEWGEGSLGTRFGGTRRDGRSNRSSSVSALSPSVASSLTMESEDEGLDGLILPTGPINFDDILKKRHQNQSPDHYTSDKPAAKGIATTDDFLAGLDIGDGDVFTEKKPNLNRNIKVKNTRQSSPTRIKTAVALTFTNKPSPVTASRLPRPHGHERVGSSLEPVSETGQAFKPRAARSQSRLGHSAQSSITSVHSLPTPTTLSHGQPLGPSTPRRREVLQKASTSALRNEPTTTNAQLLKLKRSMPIMKSHLPSPAKSFSSRYERPPSREDRYNRPLSIQRARSPDRDRSGAESSMSTTRRNPPPFLPAGASHSQSHHITAKSSRTFRRHDSESSNASGDMQLRPASRAFSRSTMRSPSPTKGRVTRGADALAREAAMKRQITKPVRRRHYGDGFELDGFDDLPTSAATEAKFVKQPVGRGAPKSLLRNKLSQGSIPDRTTTPQPSTPATPFSPAWNENVPSFARDTAASRRNREASLAQRTPSMSGPSVNSVQSQWKAQVSARAGLSSQRQKKRTQTQQKPHLIKPLGDTLNNPKSLKGMVYNPHTFRWEGNENDLSAFEAPASSPSASSIPSHYFREKENSTPRPALITNINASQGVQVVGEMVFDPVHMRWLKMSPPKERSSIGPESKDGFDALDDEEDVFKDVPDLEEAPSKEIENVGGRKSDVRDDWLVGEEFDVGPEFIRRQREEEERWRRKCEKWLGASRDALDNESWRWTIRDVVGQL